MAWTVLRTIVEELDVSATVDLLSEQHARFSETWDGIKWLLARTPTPKGAVRRLNAPYWIYVFGGDPIAGTPSVAVIWTFDDAEVTILGVMLVADSDASRAGSG